VDQGNRVFTRLPCGSGYFATQNARMAKNEEAERLVKAKFSQAYDWKWGANKERPA